MNSSAANLLLGAEPYEVPLLEHMAVLREFAAAYWPLLALVGGCLLAMLLPGILRARWPGTYLERRLSAAGGLVAVPSRMLGALHSGDVRMHVAWMVGGAALLVALVWALPLPVVEPSAGAAPGAAESAPLPIAAPDHVDIGATWPQLALVGAAVAALVAVIVLRRRAFIPALVLAVAGIAAAAFLVLSLYRQDHRDWTDLMGLMRIDPFGAAAQLAVLGVALVALVAGLPTLGRMGSRRADFLIAALLSLAGMTVAVAATDFLTLYTGLALMLVCNYILLGMQARDPLGTEAALKYFLTSLAAGGLMLFGVGLLYATTGDTQFDGLREGLADALRPGSSSIGLVRAGLALTLAGAAFLIGAAPFHMHVPDVHAGSPAPAAPFMVAAPTVTAALVLVRLVHSPLAPAAELVQPLLAVLGATSIAVGALTSWAQDNPRRVMGHLVACLLGVVLLAWTENAVPLEAVGWAARALVILLVSALAVAILAAILAAESLEAKSDEGLRAFVRRSVAAGIVFVLGMIVLCASVAALVGALRGEVSPSRRAVLAVSGLGLVIAAGRLLSLFGRLAVRRGEESTSAMRFAAAGLFLLVLAVVLAPLALVEWIVEALQLTWL